MKCSMSQLFLIWGELLSRNINFWAVFYSHCDWRCFLIEVIEDYSLLIIMIITFYVLCTGWCCLDFSCIYLSVTVCPDAYWCCDLLMWYDWWECVMSVLGTTKPLTLGNKVVCVRMFISVIWLCATREADYWTFFFHFWFIRMVEEILKTRLMVKKSMKDYKDDKVCLVYCQTEVVWK